MRSRFLMELTTPELESYFKDGGKTAILPVGCTEMHGPHQPIGTDTIVSKATALLLAERGNGVVLPDINYSWAGATDGFAGTISIEMDLVQRTIEAISLRVMKMGFKRFLIISAHNPNNLVVASVIRQIFEKYHFPAVFIDCGRALSDEAGGIFTEEEGEGKEASLVLAAVDILGKPDLYKESEMNKQDHAPQLSESFENISKVGRVGFFYQDPRQHACPSKHVSKEKGMRFIKSQVESIVPILEDIDKYSEITKNQNNRGWF